MGKELDTTTPSLLIKANAAPSPGTPISYPFHLQLMACRTMRLATIPSRRTIGSLGNVHAMRNGFKVGWIDALGASAQMIQFESRRNRADKQMVCDNMRTTSPQGLKPQSTVSVIVQCGYPVPARAALEDMSAYADLRKDTGQCFAIGHRYNRSLILAQVAVCAN